jgi:hypothetical protein
MIVDVGRGAREVADIEGVFAAKVRKTPSWHLAPP